MSAFGLSMWGHVNAFVYDRTTSKVSGGEFRGQPKPMWFRVMAFGWCNAAPWPWCNCNRQMLTLNQGNVRLALGNGIRYLVIKPIWRCALVLWNCCLWPTIFPDVVVLRLIADTTGLYAIETAMTGALVPKQLSRCTNTKPCKRALWCHQFWME